MSSIQREVFINAPVETVFSFVAHTPNLTEVWPSLVNVINWGRDAAGLATFDYTYMIAGVKVKGKNRDREFIPNKKIVTESLEGIDSLITWEFEPRGENTFVTFTAEYHIPIPVLGWMAEQAIISLNNIDLDMLMKNLKSRVEAKYRLS